MNYDTVSMPHSTSAEEAYLGSLLINPQEIKKASIHPDDLYVIRNRWIFEAMQSIYSNRHDVDVVVLSEELETREQLEELGGQSYLIDLVNKTPSSSNIESYASIIKDKSQRRRMLSLANDMVKGAYSDKELNDVVASVATKLTTISRPEGGAVHISEHVSKFYDDVMKRADDPKSFWGIETGIKEWDDITRGNQRGESTLIAARPNIGKTIFLTQMAIGMSKHVPGAFYEMESGASMIVRRVASWLGNIPSDNMKSGFMKDYMDNFIKVSETMSNLKIYFSDATNWDTVSLRADLARLKDEYKIGWFGLDYMLLLKDLMGRDYKERCDNISRNLHDICKDLDLAGIIIHTLNKAGYESGVDLQHLGGTAGVSYDADNVVFMEREKDTRIVTFDWGKIRDSASKGFMKLVLSNTSPSFGTITNDARF